MVIFMGVMRKIWFQLENNGSQLMINQWLGPGPQRKPPAPDPPRKWGDQSFFTTINRDQPIMLRWGYGTEGFTTNWWLFAVDSTQNRHHRISSLFEQVCNIYLFQKHIYHIYIYIYIHSKWWFKILYNIHIYGV